MAALWCLLAALTAPAPLPGVVVAAVRPASPAQRAGLQPADILIAWTGPQAAQGALATPWDLEEVEVEQAPRGPVRLTLERAGQRHTVTVLGEDWGLTTSPRLDSAAWWLVRAARAAETEGDRTGAISRLERALAAVTAHSGPEPALVHEELGRLLQRSGRLDEAEARLRSALDRRAPDSLAAARVFSALGAVAVERGDPASKRAASDHFRQALAVRERLAPESAAVAQSLIHLGFWAADQGELADAERHLHRARALLERRDWPEDKLLSRALNGLGRVAAERGDLERAEEELRSALAMERRRNDDTALSTTINNLGIVLRRQGELVAAEAYLRESLARDERRQPGSRRVALSYLNLGNVARDRRDQAAAEDYYRRALSIQERLAPESLAVADVLSSLAGLAVEHDDPAAAEPLLERALALRQRHAAGALDIATTLVVLGFARKGRGDAVGARACFEEALALLDGEGIRGSPAVATLEGLGELDLEAGNGEGAQALFERALALRRAGAAGGPHEAHGHYRLARVHLRAGRLERARELFTTALDLYESRHDVGGSEGALLGFHATRLFHRDLLEVLMLLEQPREAFAILERHRSHTVHALLARRGRLFSSDTPAPLEDERRAADTEYGRLRVELLRLEGRGQAEERSALHTRLEQARRRRDDARAAIQAASTPISARRLPAPPDPARVTAVLGEGTLLLSYAIAEPHSYVFALGPRRGEFQALRLEATRAELQQEVERLRTFVSLGRSLGDGGRYLRQARRLTDTLLGPVRGQVARARRLLVVPDGPLHAVPFAALADPAAPDSRFLVEAMAVHYASSAAAAMELAQRRRSAGPMAIVAFGDPEYPEPARAAPSLSRDTSSLQRLPLTRAEVRALDGLFPGATRVYLGAEATETQAKAAASKASILHFATHGVLDEQAPLESGLVLSRPATDDDPRDNGLLQAWEVFEELHLDAELVTLSACRTGLGREMGGAGLVGLTRAFQYAGARSVMASLWEVEDASTAELMRSFYAHLKAHVPKDEALRRAQRDLLRRPAASHPFHWAAFALYGDPR